VSGNVNGTIDHEGTGLWVDPDAIPDSAWHRIPLHASTTDSRSVLTTSARARFADTASASRAGIPAGRIVRAERLRPAAIPAGRIAHVDRHLDTHPDRKRAIAAPPPAGLAPAAAIAMPPAPVAAASERRHRVLAWGFLLVWLLGAWGTFFGMTGGLKSNDRSRAVTVDRPPVN